MSSKKRAFIMTVLGCAVAIASPLSAQKIPTISPEHKQLFVDDYIIGRVVRLERTLHQPVKHGPIIRPEKAWENLATQTRNAPFFVPEEKVWKLYYLAFARKGEREQHTTLLAISSDGLSWRKPELNLIEWDSSKANNLVARHETWEDFLYHVIYDPADVPERRYKAFFGLGDRQPAVSADGLHWNILPTPAITSGDESQLIYDELGKQFLSTVKQVGPYGRSVYLSTSKNFNEWTDPKLIFHADGYDQELGRKRLADRMSNPRWVPLTVNKASHYNVDIYNMPVFPYEGQYIGLPMKFHQSGPTPIGNQDGFHLVEMVSSRDLCEWSPVAGRRAFIPPSFAGPGLYDTGSVVPPSRPVVRDGELWLYYTGLKRRFQEANIGVMKDGSRRYVSVPDIGAVLLAKLRLDGFVSMDAGSQEGTLLTVPLLIKGRRLFVNVDASEGEVRAEILGQRGRKSADYFSLDKSQAVRGNHLKAELAWGSDSDLSSLEGKRVRIRFHLRKARLYSFWVTN